MWLKSKKMKNNFDEIFVKDQFDRLFDLVWYESPLTTLCYNKFDKKYYLFDWCNYTKTHNSWIVFQIDLKDLYKFVTNNISFLKLYNISLNNGAICQINSEFEYEFKETLISDIDEQYLPKFDTMFDEIDCPNYDGLLRFLNKNN